MSSTSQAIESRNFVGRHSPLIDGTGNGYRRERTPSTGAIRGTKRARATETTDENEESRKRRKKENRSMILGLPTELLYEVRGSS